MIILIVHVTTISALPGSMALNYVINFLFVAFILAINFDYYTLSRIKHRKFNFILFVGVIIFCLFLYSSFYINIGYNDNIKSISKLVS